MRPYIPPHSAPGRVSIVARRCPEALEAAEQSRGCHCHRGGCWRLPQPWALGHGRRQGQALWEPEWGSHRTRGGGLPRPGWSPSRAWWSGPRPSLVSGAHSDAIWGRSPNQEAESGRVLCCLGHSCSGSVFCSKHKREKCQVILTVCGLVVLGNFRFIGRCSRNLCFISASLNPQPT